MTFVAANLMVSGCQFLLQYVHSSADLLGWFSVSPARLIAGFSDPIPSAQIVISLALSMFAYSDGHSFFASLLLIIIAGVFVEWRFGGLFMACFYVGGVATPDTCRILSPGSDLSIAGSGPAFALCAAMLAFLIADRWGQPISRQNKGPVVAICLVCAWLQWHWSGYLVASAMLVTFFLTIPGAVYLALSQPFDLRQNH